MEAATNPGPPLPSPPHAFDPWQLGRLATRPHPFVSCWAQSPEYRELRAGIVGAVSGPHLLQTFELLQGDLVTHVQGCAGRALDEAQARHVFSQASVIYCVLSTKGASRLVAAGWGRGAGARLRRWSVGAFCVEALRCVNRENLDCNHHGLQWLDHPPSY